MSVAKVLGIETEYGIAGGPDADQIVASSIIVNAYAQEGRTRINWDFEGETPDMDARGLPDLTSFAPIVETHLANTVLTNGARLYVDHAHPEYSSPECRTPLQATLYDAAGEEVMRRALTVANEMLEPPKRSSLYKNNSDGKGNSYGTHENYLVSREVEFNHIVRAMVPHFVSRQIIVGAGKVGAETEAGHGERSVLPTEFARRVLRRGGGPRDDAEASDHQHPRRTARRRRAVPPTARHHRRRQHEPGRDVRETRARPHCCSRRWKTAASARSPRCRANPSAPFAPSRWTRA